MNARRIIGILGVILAAFLLLQPVASAQSQFATLSGEVRDPSGAAVSGAKVTVKSSLSTDTRDAVTNDEGFFGVPTLPAGSYDVSVEKPGFQVWRGKGITLNGSDSRTIRIELKVGAVTDSVVVEASTTEIAVVDSGDKSALISQKELQDLSLEGRNATEFLKILPGALLAPNAGGQNKSNYTGSVVGINGFAVGGNNGGGLSGVNINGQQVNITQDGQNTFDPGASGNATPVNPNPEMISEVKVLTSNFSSENAQGPVVVNTVTKGGGSEFHGSAYLYSRNAALNAEDHYYKELGSGKPNDYYYYPGFNIGGPVIIPKTGFNKSRQKLFFFEAYENYHQTLDGGVDRAFVPTQTMIKTGDFSAFTSTPIKNAPFATSTIPAPFIYEGPTPPYTPPPGQSIPNYPGPCPSIPITQPIPGLAIGQSCWPGLNVRINAGCTISAAGVMSSACIDPAAQILMQAFIPAPNVDPTTHGGYNYVQTFSAPMNSWQNVVRIDYDISQNTKVYGSWSRQRETANFPTGQWQGPGTPAVPSPSIILGANGSDFTTVSLVHVFSPTLTSETRFGYTYINFPNAPAEPGKLLKSAAGYPLHGIFNNPEMPAVLDWQGTIPNLGSVGYDYHPTMICYKGIPSAAENLTKVIGTHTAKFGFYYEHVYNTQDNWGQFMGVMGYAPWNSPTGNTYADILMGIGESYYEQALPPPTSIAQNIITAYAQDDWKFSRHLTLNFGLRFEHYAKPYANDGGIGMAAFYPILYDPSSGVNGNSGVLWHGIDTSVPLSGSPSRFLFYSPRVGAAYDVFGNGRTVIRGGWGMYRAYDSLQSNSYTAPTQTALGSVGYSCGQTDPACLTWETIDNYKQTPPPFNGQTGLGPGLKSVSVMDPTNSEQPLVYAYSVNIDQQLPGRFRMEVSYVGNKNKDGQAQVNTNAVPYGALLSAPASCGIETTACQQLYRPYQNYQTMTSSVTAGYGRYDSFQATLKRSYGFLTLQANYTFSKGMATSNEQGANLFGSLPNYGQAYTYGVSPLNRAQALSLAYVFNLPNTKNSNAFVRGAADGWQISGITQVESGLQIINNINAVNNFNMTPGGSNADVVHYYGTPDLTMFPVLTCNPTSNLKPGYYLNASCFAQPTPGQLGNAGMPYLPGPMFWNTDLSLMKNFKIKERQNLQFRFAFFNPLNHGLTSFTSGDSNLKLTYNALGQIITGTSCATTGPCNQQTTFGEATYKSGGRVIELGVKYSF